MIKVALVGFGLAGKTFHAPLIDSTEGLNLSVVVSSRESEVRAFYPDTKIIARFEDIFSEDIDLVVIATPNEFHFEQAKIALNHKKHVVVDKPMAQTIEEIEVLGKLATENNCILSVFHNRRFDGDFLTIKKLLTDSQLGKIYNFESNFNRFRPKVDMNKWRETTSYAGGLFFDLAPHLIDQCLNLFGKPESIFADIDCMREGAINNDYFHLIFKYPKMRAHLNASVLTASPGPRYIIHGDQESYVKFGMDVQEEQLKSGMTPEDSQYGVDPIKGECSFSGGIKQENGKYQNYYANIAQAISSDAKLLISWKDALATMKIMEDCLESHKKQNWIQAY